MVLADGAATPLGIHVEQASPAEVTLLEPTLRNGRIGGRRAKRRRPRRLIADRGYDRNAARALLVKRDSEPIIPARRNNSRATHQDGRKLRRYRRRGLIERTNAWRQSFRRLVVRYERSATVFTALVHLACALIALKKVLG
jgi:transposase